MRSSLSLPARRRIPYRGGCPIFYEVQAKLLSLTACGSIIHGVWCVYHGQDAQPDTPDARIYGQLSKNPPSQKYNKILLNSMCVKLRLATNKCFFFSIVKLKGSFLVSQPKSIFEIFKISQKITEDLFYFFNTIFW